MNNLLNKSQIVDCLKMVTKNGRVSLPRDLGFDVLNGILKITVLNPTINMQNDSAAFEGWAISLKALLPEHITEVELDFILTNHETFGLSSSISGHYNRFLYRAHFMTVLYPDWFKIADSKRLIIDTFMNLLRSNKHVLNFSKQERKSVIQSERMERQIESWFAFEEGKKLICNLWGIDEDRIFNQLPVGVFKDEVRIANAIFTRGASAIDLWGVGKNGNTLHIIELKCGKNIGMGVISETLFYTSVVYDAFVRKEHLFSLDLTHSKLVTKDIVQINNSGEKFNDLSVHILSEIFHPMFSKSVADLISDGLAKFKISFDRSLYNYSEKSLKRDVKPRGE